MHERSALIKALKATLRTKGVTYRSLAEKLKVSEPTVKRLFSREDMTLGRLEQICQAVDLSFGDLAKKISETSAHPRDQFSPQQEQALASDDRLFSYLYLLIAGNSPRQIVSHFTFSEIDGRKCLLKLDKLGLLEALPGDRVRLLVSKNVRWQPNGALWKRHALRLKEDFLNSDFGAPGENLRLLHGRLNEAALAAFNRKVDRLFSDFRDLVELSMKSASTKTRDVGFMVALRPWRLQLIAGMRRSGSKT